MEEVKYIPGDLVMTNGVPLGTAKDVVYRVTSSDPSKTLELDDGTVLKGVGRLENIEGAEFGDKGYLFGDCCAWVKNGGFIIKKSVGGGHLLNFLGSILSIFNFKVVGNKFDKEK